MRSVPRPRKAPGFEPKERLGGRSRTTAIDFDAAISYSWTETRACSSSHAAAATRDGAAIHGDGELLRPGTVRVAATQQGPDAFGIQTQVEQDVHLKHSTSRLTAARSSAPSTTSSEALGGDGPSELVAVHPPATVAAE